MKKPIRHYARTSQIMELRDFPKSEPYPNHTEVVLASDYDEASKTIAELTDALNALRKRIDEVARNTAHDYPQLESCEPWEKIYAIESTCLGVMAANGDLHALIEQLRIKCGLSKEEVADMGWPRRSPQSEPVTPQPLTNKTEAQP